jgi:hypothetical protein
MTWHHVALVLIATSLVATCIIAGHSCTDSQVNSIHTIAAAIVGVAGGNAMGGHRGAIVLDQLRRKKRKREGTGIGTGDAK